MSGFGVLLVVFYQLVVGIGSYSEATLRTSDFFRHTYRVAKATLVNLTFVILASQIGICEKRARAKAVLSGWGVPYLGSCPGQVCWVPGILG